MSEILDRAFLLPATLGGVSLLLADATAAVACAFVPLADHVGFEFAAVLAIVNALVAPAAGAAAIRLERQRSFGDRAFGFAAAAAGFYAAVLLVVPSLLMAANGLRRPTCDPASGVPWLLLLPLPTAVLAAAVGALARALSSGVWTVLLIAMVEVASLAGSLSTLYWGPSFFLFDHFFGYVPGPLYDEAVIFSSAVATFRLATLLWAGAAILACSALGAGRSRARNRAAVSAFLLTAALAILSAAYGTRLGWRTTDASLAEELGGLRAIDDLEIHYPREWGKRTVEEFARDAAFRAAQVVDALRLTHPPAVRVFVYRSPDEKRRLVGASGTSFSKPWRHEVHVNAAAFPHPVLRHELVHAFGAEVGRGPFRAPGGLLPNSPLIEGFAVALDLDADGLTLAQWAKAMRDLRLAPDVTALFSTTGFYAAAPARAYQFAGAFLRYLDGRFGRAALLDLYATGDLTRLGKPEELVAGFDRFLEAVSITASDRAAAERQLARPSVFRRRCAREVARLADEAQALLGEDRIGASVAAYERVCALEPDDPALAEPLLRAAIRAQDAELRDRVAAGILNHPKADPVLRATALMELGDDRWRHQASFDGLRMSGGDAAVRYREAAEIPVDPATRRLALVKRAAVEEPDLAELLEPLLVENDTDVKELFAMSDYIASHPADRLVRYLLGRQMVQRDAAARGIQLLNAAGGNLLGDAEMSAEAVRLVIRADAGLHRCDEAQQALDRLAVLPLSLSKGQDERGAGEADRMVGADWVARCRFEVSRGWRPVSEIRQE